MPCLPSASACRKMLWSPLPKTPMPSYEYLLTSLIVVLIPGTGVIFTISAALVHGRRAALYAALGCTAGILPHLLATVLGLAALLHASALAFQLLKFAGVAYLFYIAVMTWRDRRTIVADDQAGVPGSGTGLALKAFLLNILNPKLTIFFLAFLPQFVDSTHGAPLPQLALLSAIFMLMTFVVFVFYGLLAHAFRRTVIEAPRVQDWLRRGFAGVFAGLGIHLALSER